MESARSRSNQWRECSYPFQLPAPGLFPSARFPCFRSHSTIGTRQDASPRPFPKEQSRSTKSGHQGNRDWKWDLGVSAGCSVDDKISISIPTWSRQNAHPSLTFDLMTRRDLRIANGPMAEYSWRFRWNPTLRWFRSEIPFVGYDVEQRGMEIKRLNVSGQLKRPVFEIVPVKTLH